jgi:hypothetical protein
MNHLQLRQLIRGGWQKYQLMMHTKELPRNIQSHEFENPNKVINNPRINSEAYEEGNRK